MMLPLTSELFYLSSEMIGAQRQLREKGLSLQCL